MDDLLDSARRRRLRVRVLLSGTALALERFARAFWPLWTLAAFVGAALLSGLLPLLGGWLHAAVLGGLGLGLVPAALAGLRRWRLPLLREARTRLDRGEPERPVSVLSDRQAIGRGNAFAERVWELHRRRAAGRVDRLVPAAPNLRLSRRDPFALRTAAVLLLAAAILQSGAGWRERVFEALQPDLSASFGAPGPAPRFDVWAEPPIYTGRAPIYLTERTDSVGEVTVPTGTRLEIRAYGARRAPVLVREPLVDSGGSPSRQPLEERAEGGHALSVVLAEDGIVTLRTAGEALGSWQIRVDPDLPPSIRFAAPPQPTATGAVTFAYRVADDYGAARAWSVLRPAASPEGGGFVGLEPIEIPLAVPLSEPNAGGQESEEFVIRDLTAHPLAGTPVEAVLFVEDAAGQTGRSRTLRFTLPEKHFEEPMAAAFAEQRRKLVVTSDLKGISRAQDVLESVLRHPAGYFDDPVPFLAARLATLRLDRMIGTGPESADLAGVLDLLWRAALRLEDGGLANAIENLRDAIEKLEAALARGADEATLARLNQQLRDAVQEYLQALAERAREDGEGYTPEGAQIDSSTLAGMLDSLEGNALTGQREQARQMLRQLRSLLENLRAGHGGQGNQGLKELSEIVRDQIDLADQTMQLGRGDGSGKEGEGRGKEGSQGSAALAEGQGELRSRLDALRDQYFGSGAGGGTPPPGEIRNLLDQADGAMGRARTELGAGNSESALIDQLSAIESLRGVAREMLANSRDSAFLDGTSPGGQGVFPNYSGFGKGDLQIPGFGGVQRARELFDEIRRRSGERRRSEEERLYLERLIRRF